MNEAEIEELRRTPPEEKLGQLAALMASAEASGWSDDLQDEDEKVWKRWARLREVLLA